MRWTATMTDPQAMIREVCEGLGREYRMVDYKGEVWHLDPVTRYDHCHLLIDWMVAAGWLVDNDNDRGNWCCCFSKRNGSAYCIEDPDFRIAVLTAAWRALKDE